MSKLPKRFPVNTKYVVEACGPVIRRYVELPNGRRINLRSRKAPPKMSPQRAASIVPDQDVIEVFDRQIFV